MKVIQEGAKILQLKSKISKPESKLQKTTSLKLNKLRLSPSRWAAPGNLFGKVQDQKEGGGRKKEGRRSVFLRLPFMMAD